MSIFKKKILLLNKSYEPIKVISLEKAICLKFRDKIYVEEIYKDIYIHSQKDKWEVPSVIRLKEYTNINKSKDSSSIRRNKIYARDRRKCGYCSVTCNEDIITIDHILPKSKGGKNTSMNLVTCCITCNQRKGDRTPEEAKMPLLHSLIKFRVGLDRHEMVHYSESLPDWSKYLYLD